MTDTQAGLPVPTTQAEAVQIAAPLDGKEALARHRPPYTLLSDMLFALALVPAAPLQRQFPGAPLLALGERVPLGMWFSRVKSLRFHDERGHEQHQGSAGTVVYNELTVVAPLRRRALFSPGIYASGSLTILIGHHHYGMPKHPVQMSLHVRENALASRVLDGRAQTDVQAQWGGSGRVLAALPRSIWPWWSWPSIFPDGRQVQTYILETPRIYPAWVEGTLALSAAWLPQPVPLLPGGIYAPNLWMRLPIP